MSDNGRLNHAATCKVCGATMILPVPTPIVGTDPLQAQIAAGFIELMKHMAGQHKDMRQHSQMWAAMFSEYYVLAMFDLDGVLQQAKDLKRVQLRRVVDGPDDAALEKSLEAAGFQLAKGFLDEEKVVKL